MHQTKINQYGTEFYRAMRKRTVVPPLTELEPSITIEEAYQISLTMLDQRLADNEIIVGKKIGITSPAVQDMLEVDQPDFGFLTDAMQYADRDTIPISEILIQPKAEGEIAFILKQDLEGPGISSADVLKATEVVAPCFEIVDSRIRDWQIRIQDTIADNASCGLFALGDVRVPPDVVDFEDCEMVVTTNGELSATGKGSMSMGSPLNSVAWLANTLGRFGRRLEAGDVILSGSLVPLLPIKPGDTMHVGISGIGDASVTFT